MTDAAKMFANVCAALFDADVKIAYEWSGNVRGAIRQAYGRHLVRLVDYGIAAGVNMDDYAIAAGTQYQSATYYDGEEDDPCQGVFATSG